MAIIHYKWPLSTNIAMENPLFSIIVGNWNPLVICDSSPWKPWPIEIDGFTVLNFMVDLSMANC